jgi:hypothetical protein
MKRREWSPLIPGTEHGRLEFLHAVQKLSQSLGNPTVDEVRAVAEYEILNMTQVARIIGCPVGRVRSIYDAFNLPKPNNRGQFSFGAIDALITVCKKRALGEVPPRELMEGLTTYVTPAMLEALTDTPVSTYWFHRKNKERKRYASKAS